MADLDILKIQLVSDSTPSGLGRTPPTKICILTICFHLDNKTKTFYPNY